MRVGFLLSFSILILDFGRFKKYNNSKEQSKSYKAEGSLLNGKMHCVPSLLNEIGKFSKDGNNQSQIRESRLFTELVQG